MINIPASATGSESQSKSTQTIQSTLYLELSDTNGNWDGVKWYPVSITPSGPSTIEVIWQAAATASSVQTRVQLYDMDDNLLISSDPITVSSDGSRQTFTQNFDLSSITPPAVVVVQLEFLVDSTGQGYTDFIEVRW